MGCLQSSEVVEASDVVRLEVQLRHGIDLELGPTDIAGAVDVGHGPESQGGVLEALQPRGCREEAASWERREGGPAALTQHVHII